VKRVGVVTSWGSRCGIAEYSRSLLGAVPLGRFDLLVLADDEFEFADSPLPVVRCWTRGDGDVAGILEAARREALDAVVFQFNWGYLDPHAMGEALGALQSSGVRTIVQFHSTQGHLVEGRDETLEDIAPALAAADALVVHTEADEAEARRIAPGARIVRAVLGQRSFPDESSAEVREVLGIAGRTPVVATFGFLLPHKGVLELIRSVPVMSRTWPGVCLLVVCSVIPTMRASAELRLECAIEAHRLGVEDRVALVHEFLPESVAMTFLHAADVIALPYGYTPESASAAARFVLSAGRPVMTSTAPIFDALGGAVHRIGDITPHGIARGVSELMADEARRSELVSAASQMTRMAEWPALGREFAELLDEVLGSDGAGAA